MSLNADVAKLVVAVARRFANDIDKTGGAVAPMIALSDSPPEIKIVIQESSARFSHDTARKLAGKAVACVEVWDGYVTIAGQRTEAMLFNVWERGAGPVFMAQRYRRRPFQLLGALITGDDYSIEQR